jgi:hypothetical protein
MIRTLGVIGLLCSPALLAVWLMGGVDNPAQSRPVVFAQLLFLAGWFCSLLAMVELSAAGRRFGRYLLWIQLGGVAMASTQEFQDLLMTAPDHAAVYYRAADAAWPLSVLFMNVVGVAVARAGVFSGWRRFPAILCGLSLPLSLLTAAVAGRQAMGPAFGIMTTLAWGTLAWAVLSSSSKNGT